MKSIVFCIKQVSGDRRLLDSPQLDPPPTPPYGGRGEASGGKSQLMHVGGTNRRAVIPDGQERRTACSSQLNHWSSGKKVRIYY